MSHHNSPSQRRSRERFTLRLLARSHHPRGAIKLRPVWDALGPAITERRPDNRDIIEQISRIVVMLRDAGVPARRVQVQLADRWEASRQVVSVLFEFVP
jgi:hypothetical protein